MTFGNWILLLLSEIKIFIRIVVLIESKIGPYAALRFLSIVSLRGKVSESRRYLEKNFFCNVRGKGENMLLVGVKSYNFHYIPYYSIFRKLTVVEPSPRICVPSTVRFINDKLENFVHTSVQFDFINLFGVYGYGINTVDQLLSAAGVLNNLLKEGGEILFGVNITHDPEDLWNYNNFVKYFYYIKNVRRIEVSKDVVVYLGCK